MIKEIKSKEDHALAVSQLLTLVDIELETGTEERIKLSKAIYGLASAIEDFEEEVCYE